MQRLATARTLQAARESGTCGLQEHADGKHDDKGLCRRLLNLHA